MNNCCVYPVRNKKGQFLMEKHHPNWKGKNVSYTGLHIWIKRKFGKPIMCEICKTKKSKRYEWANKGIYDRERKNWISLCTKCHNKLDKKTPEYCFCGNLYYAKGMCKKCYNKSYYLNNKNKYEKK